MKHETRRRLEHAAYWLLAIVVSVILAMIRAYFYMRGSVEASHIAVGAGIETRTLNFLWTATAGFAENAQFIAGVGAILVLGTARTHLGAGRTRHQVLARLARSGAIGILLYLAAIAVLWGVSFLAASPDLIGVSPATVVLIGLNTVTGFAWGAMFAALFLRFHWGAVVLGYIGLAGVFVAIDSMVGKAFRGITINMTPPEIHYFGLSEVTSNYITNIFVLLAASIVTYAAVSTLPMRRS